MIDRTLVFIWILSWSSILSDATSVQTELRNSTLLNGGNLEFQLLSFSLNSGETFTSLLCGVDRPFLIRFAFYDTTLKSLILSSDISTNLPDYVGRIFLRGNTTVIRNITFSDEKTIFQCVLQVSLGREPKTANGPRHELKQVQEPPSVAGTPLPSVFTIREKTGANLTCQFIGRPQATITWEGSIVRLGSIKTTSEMSGTYRTITTSTLSIKTLEARHNDFQGGCVALNAAGSARQMIKLNVTYLPTNTSIIVSPSNPAEGQNIRIQCSSVSNPMILEYTILKDGLSISKSVSGVFTFLSKNCSAESGQYSCIPRNSIGEGMASHLNLTVKGQPKITSITSSTTLNESQSITLRCISEGCPKPLIQWSKSNRLLIQSQMYVISNAQPEDGGTYRCKASNTLNSTTKEVNIIVNYKPRNVSLVSTATNGVIREGARLVVNCSARGHPTVKYRLFFKGTLIPNSSAGVVIYEQASCLLHTGNYSCEAYNDLGSAAREILPVSVEGIPAFTQIPISRVVNESNSVTFTCKAAGCPVPTVGFRKMGSHVILKRGDTFTVTGAKVENAGMYVCDANSSIGSNMTTFSLTVQYKPRGLKLNAPVQAVLDSAVTLTCTSSAVPAPTYKFFKKVIGNPTEEVRSGNSATSGELRIANIKHDNNYRAVYQCSASNLLGTANSPDASINVLVPPNGISATPSRVTVNETERVSVSCTVSNANPSANYTWTKNPGNNLVERSRAFTITNSNRSHSGDYVCTASNGIGTPATVTVVVSVQYSPSVSSSLQRTFSTCVGQTISPTCSGIGNPTPFVELIRGSDVLASGQGHVQHNVQVTDASFGNYTCRVRNLLGLSERILTVVKQVIPGVPMSPSVTSKEDTLVVQWKRPLCSGRLPISYYWVYYKKASDTNYTRSRVDCSSADCELKLTGLQAETKYNISISAVDTAGKEGMRSQIAKLPTTGQRATSSDDSIPIYAGAAGGAALLLLLIIVGVIIYRGRKRGQVNPRDPVDIIVEQSSSDKVVVNIKAARSGSSNENKDDRKPYTGTAMYDGNPSFLNSTQRLDAKRKNDVENGSVDSLHSKASSSNYKGTFGKKKGKGMKENGRPASPAFVKGETNNSFLAESDGAYEPVTNYAGNTPDKIAPSMYAQVNKKPPRNYADLSDLSSFSSQSDSRHRNPLDDYLKTNYAELNDLGPLRDAEKEPKSPGKENLGYQEINEV